MGISYNVVVAVGRGKNSRGALKWCLQTLMKEGDILPIIHIRPPVQTIPTPLGKFPVGQVDKGIVTEYLREINLKVNKSLECFKLDCASYKVQAEIILVEHDSVKKALLEKIRELGIGKLILGTSGPTVAARVLKACRKKLRSQGLSAYISKHSPPYCAVLAIRRGRLYSVKDATTAEKNSPLCSITDDSQPNVLLSPPSSEVDAGVAGVGGDGFSSSSFKGQSASILQASESDFAGVIEEDLGSSSQGGSSASNLSEISQFQNQGCTYSHRVFELPHETNPAPHGLIRSKSSSIDTVDDYSEADILRRLRNPIRGFPADDTARKIFMRPPLGPKSERPTNRHMKLVQNRVKKAGYFADYFIKDVPEEDQEDVQDLGSAGSSSWSSRSEMERLERSSFSFDDDAKIDYPIAPVRVEAFEGMLAAQASPYRSPIITFEDRLKQLHLASEKTTPLGSPELERESVRSSILTEVVDYEAISTGQLQESLSSLEREHSREINRLSFELQKACLATKKAKRDADNEVMQRKKAEQAAIRAADKAEEYAVKFLRESEMRAKAFEVAKHYRKIAEEDAKFYEQKLEAVSVARQFAEQKAASFRREAELATVALQTKNRRRPK